MVTKAYIQHQHNAHAAQMEKRLAIHKAALISETYTREEVCELLDDLMIDAAYIVENLLSKTDLTECLVTLLTERLKPTTKETK